MLGLGMQEMILVGVVAVLLFGKRLPEVARSVGASYNQFRKGLQEIQSEMSGVTDSYYSTPTSGSGSSSHSTYDEDDYEEPTAPKFEPPPAGSLDEPKGESSASELTAEVDARSPAGESSEDRS